MLAALAGRLAWPLGPITRHWKYIPLYYSEVVGVTKPLETIIRHESLNDWRAEGQISGVNEREVVEEVQDGRSGRTAQRDISVR